MAINRGTFFSKVRETLFKGSLRQSQVDGMGFMLDAFEARYNWPDLRWIAYCFATAYHETAYTMQPIKEYGSQSYLQSKPYYPYFGRGYVQLTWEDNYRKMGSKLGVNMLGENMDKALIPSVAAEIMYVGMRDGDFTGKKLSTYFSSSNNDPVNARRIINGTDKAKEISEHHYKFLSAFEAASVSAPPVPSEPTAPPAPNAPDMSVYVTRDELAKMFLEMAERLGSGK
jgi:putative chitinase